MVKSCVRESYGADFPFYLHYFLFLSSLRTFTASKMLFWNAFVSNAQLAQSVERGANNGKLLCSRLIRSSFHFLFGLFSLFK